jgi:hypothetical protein
MNQINAVRSWVEQYHVEALRETMTRRLSKLCHDELGHEFPAKSGLRSHDRTRHARQPLRGTRPLATLCEEIGRSDLQW